MTDLVAAFPVAMAELHAAVHSPGALDRTINAPFGEVPGDVFARFVAMDGLVHGWDIATATGQAYDPPAALVSAVDAFTRQAISDGHARRRHLRRGGRAARGRLAARTTRGVYRPPGVM